VCCGVKNSICYSVHKGLLLTAADITAMQGRLLQCVLQCMLQCALQCVLQCVLQCALQCVLQYVCCSRCCGVWNSIFFSVRKGLLLTAADVTAMQGCLLKCVLQCMLQCVL